MDIEQAEARYREALAAGRNLGMRPLQAHCHAGLAQVYVAAGAVERARAEFNAAIELYRAMAMTTWLAKAENSLSRLS